MSTRRTVPEGYIKTSYEIAEATKFALEDLRMKIRRETGSLGISEAAIIEALILATKKGQVDLKLLEKVIKARSASRARRRGD